MQRDLLVSTQKLIYHVGMVVRAISKLLVIGVMLMVILPTLQCVSCCIIGDAVPF